MFFGMKGIIFVDYLGDFIAHLLDHLDIQNMEKTTTKLLFLNDNASVHSSVVASAKVHYSKFALLPHLPNSLDLAPSDAL